MKILSVQDTKAERFGNPFVSPNLAVADRDFALACKEPKSPMCMFPDDIQLVCIGDFDENTGKIKPIEPVIVCTARQYIKKEKENKKNS